MYSVKLENFEGPLDLLLFFIKRDELDIYDIPIAAITAEFLEYVQVLEMLDLELAGEFVVMASTLVSIKAQMLLPREPTGVAGEPIEEEDPRAELVRKLLEYKRFKEAAESLSISSENQRYVLYRQLFEGEEIHAASDGSYRNATLIDLLRALKRAIERAEDEPAPHVVQRFPITVEEKSEEIVHLLRTRPFVQFFELITGRTRMHIVVTFLALLELTKNAMIRVRQDDRFDDIVIILRGAEDAPAEPTSQEVQPEQ